MRAPAISPVRPLGRLALLFVALALATLAMTTPAKADGPSDAEADGEAAVVDGAVGESTDGASDAEMDAVPAAGASSPEPADAPTLASYLSGGMLRVSADVPLMGDGEPVEPVVGSFTVDGLTYAIVGEGQVALVAASPRTLAGGLVGGSDVAPDGSVAVGSSGADGEGRGIGSGVPTSPQPQPSPSAEAAGSGEFGDGSMASELVGAGDEGAGLGADGAEGLAAPGPDADSDDEGPGEPATLTLPDAVSYDGINYSLATIGPRALAGCDAATVVLSASVALVDQAAFEGSSVASVEVAEGNPRLASFDGMLFDAGLTRLLLVPEGKQGAARIPKEAEVVDPSCFSHSAGVSAIDVEAGSAAFSSRNGSLYDASGKTLLRVPAGATDVQIADGCATVAAGSLEGCAVLATIHAPASVVEVGKDILTASSMASAYRDEALRNVARPEESHQGGEDLMVFVKTDESAGLWREAIPAASVESESSPSEDAVLASSGAFAARVDFTVHAQMGAGGDANLQIRPVTINADGSRTDGNPSEVYKTTETKTFNFNTITARNVSFKAVWDDYPHYALEWDYDATGLFNKRFSHYRFAWWNAGRYMWAISINGHNWNSEVHEGSRSVDISLMPGSSHYANTTTLKPIWYAIPTYILYNSTTGEGLDLEPPQYTISDSDILLPLRSKPGYQFLGWDVQYSTNVFDAGGPEDYDWKYKTGDAAFIKTKVVNNILRQYIPAGKWSHLKLTEQYTERVLDLQQEHCAYKMHRTFIADPGATASSSEFSAWYHANTGSWRNDEPPSHEWMRWNGTARGAYWTLLFVRNDYTAAEYNLKTKNGRYLYRLYVEPDDGYEFDKWDGLDERKLVNGEYYNCEEYPELTLVKAICKAKTYDLTYDLGGGSTATTAPSTYNIENDDIAIPNPTKRGHQFAGWTVSGSSGSGIKQTTESNGQVKAVLQKGTWGDITLTAKWTERCVTLDTSPGTLTIERYRPPHADGSLNFEKVTMEDGVWTAKAHEWVTLYHGPKRWEAVAITFLDDAGDTRMSEYVFGTRLGYKMAGWTKDGKDVTTAGSGPDDKHVFAEATGTYKVKWQPISYSVKYKTSWDGGTYSTKKHLYRDKDDPDYGVNDYAQELNDYMREHEGGPWYTFEGWSKDPNDDVADYEFEQVQPNLSTTDGDEVTLYVAKQKNEATFDPAGGTLLTHRQDDPDATIAVDDGPVTVAWTGDTLVSGGEPRVTYDCTYEQGDDRRCIDVVRAGYAFAGWEAVDRAGESMGEEWRDEPIARGATYRAKWVPALRVDVPLAVDMDLTVDWGKDSVVLGRPGEEGPGYVVGELASYSAEEVRVAAVGQEVGAVASYRANALAVLAGGDEAKAANLGKARLTLSADRDGAPQLSVPLAELYANPDGSHPGSMASPQDVTGLGLVVPAAASAEQPGVLGVRYGMDCAGLPLEDVALDSRARPVLKLVYLMGLAGS